MATPQPVRGTQSLLGEDADRFHTVIEAFDRVRRLFGFKRVEVPTLEHASVFARTMGETTDVVSKEMYTLEDKGGDLLALRPEFTAGIARAFLSEGWRQFAPLKVTTYGSAFRYERPQKGRFREFHQLDAEVIGAAEATADVEIISLAHQLLCELGIGDEVTLELNTLGDQETRGSWRSALVLYFEQHREHLSPESQNRLYTNPLRILDSKDPRDRAIMQSAPAIDMYFTPDAAFFLSDVERGLEAAGVRWKRNPRLVRGLDYYRHTVFEFVTDRLGAQGTVIAGGRYDGLIEMLGGPHTPAVGWAAGIERLAMMLPTPDPQIEAPELVLIPDSDEDIDVSLNLLRLLRENDIRAEMAFSGSSKKRYEKAKKSSALRALTVTSWDVDAYAVVRIRDLKASAPPVRRRLRQALEQHFNVREDEHRAFHVTLKA